VYRTARLASCGAGHRGAALSFMVMGGMFGEPAHKKEQQEHFRKNRWLKKERKKAATSPLRSRQNSNKGSDNPQS